MFTKLCNAFQFYFAETARAIRAKSVVVFAWATATFVAQMVDFAIKVALLALLVEVLLAIGTCAYQIAGNAGSFPELMAWLLQNLP